MTCLPTFHAAMLGTIAAVFILLAVAYLVSVARKVRLCDRALQVLGSIGNEPPSMDTAYLRLHEIEYGDRLIDAHISRAMRRMRYMPKATTTGSAQ